MLIVSVKLGKLKAELREAEDGLVKALAGMCSCRNLLCTCMYWLLQCGELIIAESDNINSPVKSFPRRVHSKINCHCFALIIDQIHLLVLQFKKNMHELYAELSIYVNECQENVFARCKIILPDYQISTPQFLRDA